MDSHFFCIEKDFYDYLLNFDLPLNWAAFIEPILSNSAVFFDMESLGIVASSIVSIDGGIYLITPGHIKECSRNNLDDAIEFFVKAVLIVNSKNYNAKDFNRDYKNTGNKEGKSNMDLLHITKKIDLNILNEPDLKIITDNAGKRRIKVYPCPKPKNSYTIAM